MTCAPPNRLLVYVITIRLHFSSGLYPQSSNCAKFKFWYLSFCVGLILHQHGRCSRITKRYTYSPSFRHILKRKQSVNIMQSVALSSSFRPVENLSRVLAWAVFCWWWAVVLHHWWFARCCHLRAAVWTRNAAVWTDKKSLQRHCYCF